MVAFAREFAARPFVTDVLVPLLATRAALIGIALIAFRLPVDAALDTSPNHLLTALSRWDGIWYVHIAAQGYDYTDGDFTSVAFAPLLPLLMRALGPLFGGGMDGLLIAGAVIVNVALALACVLLVKLTSLDFDEADARRVPLYVLVFPTSFFLSAVYPEAIFLALAVGAFYAARRDRWIIAGALAALCVLARPHGILILPALALEYLYQRGFSPRAVRADVLALLMPLVAFGAWLLFQYAKFGDPLAFVHAQGAWQRVPGPPWNAFTVYFSGAPHGPWNDFLFAIALLIATAYAAMRLRPSYALYAALLVLAPISTGQLYSLMRFGVSIFPLFIALALLGRHPLFDRAYVSAGLLIGGAFITIFASSLLFLA